MWKQCIWLQHTAVKTTKEQTLKTELTHNMVLKDINTVIFKKQGEKKSAKVTLSFCVHVYVICHTCKLTFSTAISSNNNDTLSEQKHLRSLSGKFQVPMLFFSTY